MFVCQKNSNDSISIQIISKFDFADCQNNKQNLNSKDMRVIGDELIFGKLFHNIGCRIKQSNIDIKLKTYI